MFIALREETVGFRRSPMFSLAVDISLLWSEVVSITHPSYKHLTAPRSGPGQRSSTHYYPTTKEFASHMPNAFSVFDSFMFLYPRVEATLGWN